MRFTKLSSNFWNSKAGRAVRTSGPQGFAIYWYLRSSDHGNYIGIYKLNLDYAAIDLGITSEVMMQYIKEFEDANLVSYDPENEIIWIIDQAEVQVGELKKGDKKIIGVNKDVAAIERSTIRDEFFNKYRQLLKLCDTLGPAQPGASLTSDDLKIRNMDFQPAPPTVGLPNMSDNYLDGVLSVLLSMRKEDRKNYPEVRDMCVKEDAVTISKKVGIRCTVDLIHEAIAARDLNLVAALKSISLRDI